MFKHGPTAGTGGLKNAPQQFSVQNVPAKKHPLRRQNALLVIVHEVLALLVRVGAVEGGRSPLGDLLIVRVLVLPVRLQ